MEEDLLKETKKQKSQGSLMEMTEKWMSLERKTLKQRQEAEQFYEKNLMKLIEKDRKSVV